MNVADDVGTAEDQDLAAVFLAPVVVEGGVALLDVGAHGAVVDYDAVLYELEKFGHWWSVVRRWSFVVRGFVVRFLSWVSGRIRLPLVHQIGDRS